MCNNELLEYCWKHKLLGIGIRTIGGREVEVVDQGLHNHHDGPTFFNAKVRIDGTLLVGNVKCMADSEEWYDRKLHADKRYDNVILVVCLKYGPVPINSQDKPVAMAQVAIPDCVRLNYEALMEGNHKGMTRCHHHVNEFTSSLARHAWFAAMQTEHLEQESENIRRLAREHGNDWQWAFTGQLLRAFGLGINNDTMTSVYSTIPSRFFASSHVDDLFQVESVVFGEAGLLELGTIPEKYQESALMEGYFAKLRNEWLYLAHKFDMPKPAHYEWKSIGRGKHATPHVLLSMLANLIYMRKSASFGMLADVKDLKDVYALIITNATPYWQMHSHFGMVTEKKDKPLSRDRQSRIIMDCHIPLMFAYGRYKGNDKMCDFAFDLMEQMKLYRTPETAYFERFGIKPSTAGDVVALCHMKACYCDKRNCINCRFGYEFMKLYQQTKEQACI